MDIVAAVLIGWARFVATIHLNLWRFFHVTSRLLILFAHQIYEFIEVGWIPPTLDPVEDIHHVLSDESISGVI